MELRIGERSPRGPARSKPGWDLFFIPRFPFQGGCENSSLALVLDTVEKHHRQFLISQDNYPQNMIFFFLFSDSTSQSRSNLLTVPVCKNPLREDC